SAAGIRDWSLANRASAILPSLFSMKEFKLLRSMKRRWERTSRPVTSICAEAVEVASWSSDPRGSVVLTVDALLPAPAEEPASSVSTNLTRLLFVGFESRVGGAPISESGLDSRSCTDALVDIDNGPNTLKRLLMVALAEKTYLSPGARRVRSLKTSVQNGQSKQEASNPYSSSESEI
ncbi:hypothetical protein C8J57DRAFT_1301153, partial [Mycena rebaudengoi]